MRHDRIRIFYEENRQGLYTYALSLTRCASAAEDAVHQVICNMLRRAILPRKLKPYAYSCVRNAVIDDWRKYAARCESILDSEYQAAVRSDGHLSMDLERALNFLGPEEREVIVLKAINGLTFREIAAISKTSINTISSQYRRGLQKLKDRLEEDAHE